MEQVLLVSGLVGSPTNQLPNWELEWGTGSFKGLTRGKTAKRVLVAAAVKVEEEENDEEEERKKFRVPPKKWRTRRF